MDQGQQGQRLAAQVVDLYKPFIASRPGHVPLVIRVAVPNGTAISEGVPIGGARAEAYVLLSALPEELRRRVEIAVQALITGG